LYVGKKNHSAFLTIISDLIQFSQYLNFEIATYFQTINLKEDRNSYLELAWKAMCRWRLWRRYMLLRERHKHKWVQCWGWGQQYRCVLIWLLCEIYVRTGGRM